MEFIVVSSESITFAMLKTKKDMKSFALASFSFFYYFYFTSQVKRDVACI